MATLKKCCLIWPPICRPPISHCGSQKKRTSKNADSPSMFHQTLISLVTTFKDYHLSLDNVNETLRRSLPGCNSSFWSKSFPMFSRCQTGKYATIIAKMTQRYFLDLKMTEQKSSSVSQIEKRISSRYKTVKLFKSVVEKKNLYELAPQDQDK